MQLDKLQIELRPRSNAQALDLGLALLHAQGSGAYRAWLALWLPLSALACLLCALAPGLGWLWITLAWWVRPALERAPLYVLSRQVFGETVSWREAVRAWPRQLGGGMWAMLTWARPFCPGRCLMQPVWQLEMARGKVARARRAVLARDGSGRAAGWFGAVCANFEGVIQLGVIAAVGLFYSDTLIENPFALFMPGQDHTTLLAVLGMGAFALSGAIIGPVYVACGFTLYLNRRARLEAWDIEIVLRQIVPPAPSRPGPGRGLAALLAAPLLLALALGSPGDAWAADADCKPLVQPLPRAPGRDGAQAGVRKAVDTLYAGAELREYECIDSWRFKEDKTKKEKPLPLFDLSWLALPVKVLAIALAVIGAGWLLYRYRDRLPSFGGRSAALATEVAGLDIRASSLPPDVPASVRALWAQGERRAALALLYRATLARLVDDNGLQVRAGATEGDCLRAVRQAGAALPAARVQLAGQVTMVWLQAAYGDRWPLDAAVEEQCRLWQAGFGAAP